MKTILIILFLAAFSFFTNAQTHVYANGRNTFCFWGGTSKTHTEIMKLINQGFSVDSFNLYDTPVIINYIPYGVGSCCAQRTIFCITCSKACLRESERGNLLTNADILGSCNISFYSVFPSDN